MTPRERALLPETGTKADPDQSFAGEEPTLGVTLRSL